MIGINRKNFVAISGLALPALGFAKSTGAMPFRMNETQLQVPVEEIANVFERVLK